MYNKKTKMFLLFTLIFIAMMGLSAVTAANIDNDTTDVPVIAETHTTDVVDDVQTTNVDNKAQIKKNNQTDVKTKEKAPEAEDFGVLIRDDVSEKGNTTVTINPLENVKWRDEFTITGLLQDDEGNGLNNQNITIKFNDEEVRVTTRSGQFTYNTTAKIVGENNITASYDGPKYAASTTNYTFTVEKATTLISVNDESMGEVPIGNVTTITGILTDGQGKELANKVIRILVNDNARKTLRTDDTGTFTFNYTVSRAGINTLKATFEGDAYYNASSTEIEFVVPLLATSITFDPLENVTKGTVTTISGNLTDENNKTLANKQVKIKINNSTKTLKTDDKGRFTFNYTFGKIGEINITATYLGTQRVYNQIETNLTLNVTKANVTVKIEPMESVTWNTTATIRVTVNTTGGAPVAGVQVKITINGSPKTLKTDENGVVTHTFRMIKIGTNIITASSKANNNFNNATEVFSTVEVIKAE